MRDLCNFFRGNFNCNDVPATHQGHVLGVPRELAVEDEVNPGVVHLPGILQRGHVEAVLYCTVLYCTVLCTVLYCAVLYLQRGHVVAVLGPVLGQARHLLPLKLLQSCQVRVSASNIFKDRVGEGDFYLYCLFSAIVLKK